MTLEETQNLYLALVDISDMLVLERLRSSNALGGSDLDCMDPKVFSSTVALRILRNSEVREYFLSPIEKDSIDGYWNKGGISPGGVFRSVLESVARIRFSKPSRKFPDLSKAELV